MGIAIKPDKRIRTEMTRGEMEQLWSCRLERTEPDEHGDGHLAGLFADVIAQMDHYALFICCHVSSLTCKAAQDRRISKRPRLKLSTLPPPSRVLLMPLSASPGASACHFCWKQSPSQSLLLSQRQTWYAPRTALVQINGDLAQVISAAGPR
jgi:hypothetical protein